MNQIGAGFYKSKFANSSHPVLLIDNVPIAVWAEQMTANEDWAEAVDGLVPAQGWLQDESESDIAWYLLIPKDVPASTIVPILICPDDLDMACTVVVVEQVTDGRRISWLRLGRALDVRNGVVVSVAWAAQNTPVQFDYSSFCGAVAELRQLTDEAWR